MPELAPKIPRDQEGNVLDVDGKKLGSRAAIYVRHYEHYVHFRELKKSGAAEHNAKLPEAFKAPENGSIDQAVLGSEAITDREKDHYYLAGFNYREGRRMERARRSILLDMEDHYEENEAAYLQAAIEDARAHDYETTFGQSQSVEQPDTTEHLA